MWSNPIVLFAAAITVSICSIQGEIVVGRKERETRLISIEPQPKKIVVVVVIGVVAVVVVHVVVVDPRKLPLKFG